MRRLARHGLLFLGYGALGVFATLVAVYISSLQQRPDLQPWHLASLDGEFTARDHGELDSLEAYVHLEGALFRQLGEQVFASDQARQARPYIRYSSGSSARIRSREPDWNRTVERRHPSARGAAMLVHGLSDSPYSMRGLADLFYDQGFSVLTLRLPGHGTAPAGLLSADHRDWMAALRLGMRHLASQIEGEQPLYLVGYSMGAALSVEYAASRLLGEDVPAVDGLILLSPAIGVSSLARLAVWQSRLAALPGMSKLAWTDILPEYDPYKYNSFTVSAGDQIYRLTQRIAAHLDAAASPDGVRGMPPILAFQSVVDATVSSAAVLEALFLRLAGDGHQLVAFDINRNADVAPLLAQPAADVQSRLLELPDPSLDVTLVVNASVQTNDVVAIRRSAGTTRTSELGMAWPTGVYSLSHVALPFSPADPIYGAEDPDLSDSVFLGKVALYGERGLLSVSGDGLMRLRHNPFFGYVEKRIVAFLNDAP